MVALSPSLISGGFCPVFQENDAGLKADRAASLAIY
jgi:hypothetical protein